MVYSGTQQYTKGGLGPGQGRRPGPGFDPGSVARALKRYVPVRSFALSNETCKRTFPLIKKLTMNILDAPI